MSIMNERLLISRESFKKWVESALKSIINSQHYDSDSTIRTLTRPPTTGHYQWIKISPVCPVMWLLMLPSIFVCRQLARTLQRDIAAASRRCQFHGRRQRRHCGPGRAACRQRSERALGREMPEEQGISSVLCLTVCSKTARKSSMKWMVLRVPEWLFWKSGFDRDVAFCWR